MDAVDGGASIATPAQAYDISVRSLIHHLLKKTLTTRELLCEHLHISNMHLICNVSNAFGLIDMLDLVNSTQITRVGFNVLV